MVKSSSIIVCISEIFPPEVCILESSACISVMQFEILKGRLFIYKTFWVCDVIQMTWP
jgi:hypothetical protein